MQAPETIEIVDATGARARGACLVSGCTCKDSRIVSYRRAAFFAARGPSLRPDRRPDHRRGAGLATSPPPKSAQQRSHERRLVRSCARRLRASKQRPRLLPRRGSVGLSSSAYR